MLNPCFICMVYFQCATLLDSHSSSTRHTACCQYIRQHTHTEAHTQRFLQFNMNYLEQTVGSVGQQSVLEERLMVAFYCSRRSRSSKLSFCSPQGARAAAVRIHSALCSYMGEELGQAHSHRNVFTGGLALSGHHNIVVLPFCASERGACETPLLRLTQIK